MTDRERKEYIRKIRKQRDDLIYENIRLRNTISILCKKLGIREDNCVM